MHYRRYPGTFDNHFSTTGLLGMNEAGLNARWIGKDLTHKQTQDFAVRVLNHMRERLRDYQELYGDLYNLEATPYCTLSPTYSVCADHGYISGEAYTCPNCRIVKPMLQNSGIPFAEKNVAEFPGLAKACAGVAKIKKFLKG